MTTITIDRATAKKWLEQFQSCDKAGDALYAALTAEKMFRAALSAPATAPSGKFKIGDHVRKVKGSQWRGRIVGWYSTELTPVGWAVESDTERGSVQIYPEAALELIQ